MLVLTEDVAIGPVCALHWIEHGLITAAREYHTDPETMERIGMIPPAQERGSPTARR